MENLEKQIKEQYHKAFYDLIEERSKDIKNPENREWIVRLYAELRKRLGQLVPNRADIHKELVENLDIELFNQMLEYEIFNSQDMRNLINYTFSFIKKFEAPYMDEDTNKDLASLYELMKTENLSVVIAQFLKIIHTKLDMIEKDINNFMNI